MINIQPVGVIGAGSFGTAIANVLSKNRKVLLYSRNPDVVETIAETGIHKGQKINPDIQPTTDLKELVGSCNLIFPIVPSANFREMIRTIAPYLQPSHILIHGTKGFDVTNQSPSLTRAQVRTISEVITEETVVKRVGCFSGPNLSRELADDQLAGTVVASKFDEVLKEGQKALASGKFKVYESYNIIGVELAGALKNVMAIAAGALTGLGYGENARAMLITRGLAEMVFIGKALGGNTEAFLGLAGIGDLVATCSSTMSRNFTLGFRIAKGEKLNDILSSMNDVVEGVHTIKVVKSLADYYQVRCPITQTLYKVLFKGLPIAEAIGFLMNYPITKDVDFL